MVLSLKCIGCGGFQIKLSLGFLEFVHIYSASADKAGFIHADFHSQGHYMDGKGKLKSRLILQVTQSCFFEGKRFTIPEGKKEGWGTGSTRCCFCADWQVFLHHGTWPRSQGWEELRCLHVFRQLWIPNKECCLMGCATSVLFWPAHSCHLIFFPSWYSPSFCTNESSTMEWCEWIFSVLSKSWDYQSWFSCQYSLLFEMLSQSKYLRWC